MSATSSLQTHMPLPQQQTGTQDIRLQEEQKVISWGYRFVSPAAWGRGGVLVLPSKK